MAKEIKIVGVNKEKTERDDSFPSAVSIYFDLSEEPDSQWIQCFEQFWKEHLYSMKRKAFCEGKYIRMVVASSDNMRQHKEELEKAVTETNQMYEKIISKTKAEESRQMEEEKRIVEEAKRKLENL